VVEGEHMTQSDESDTQVSAAVPLVWVGADDLPVHFANQFVSVVQANEIFLTIGSVVPPAILGSTVEERKAEVERITYVPVKPIARLGLTPAGLKQLIEVLQTTLEKHEQLPRQESDQ
jgi:hypothetical protein